MKESAVYRFLFLLFLLLFVACAACSPIAGQPSAEPSTQTTQSQTPVGNSENTQPSATAVINANNQQEDRIEAEDTPQSSPTLEHTPTPLPLELRDVPEDFNWKELPIQPEINEHAFEIYQHGMSLGRNPNHISVIGDCQAIPFVFLGRYGINQYTLSGTDSRLEPMIEEYRESFAREGAAVRGGFTAAAVLSPVRSDPDLCMPGENPLECEWRIHNPSIAFINLETWREEGTVDRYETYLQKIVEFTLEQGTLPIIIMKADKAEAETHVINPAMARVAYQYDIPIINFWQAVQYIENRGIDPDRDGFHLSEEGYHLKETLALRTLFEVWSAVQEAPQATPQPSLTPTQTLTPVPVEPTLSVPAFQCQSNCLYYDLFVQSGNGVEVQGIYEFNLDTLEKHLLFDQVALMDMSPDQNQFLITRETELYLVNRNRQSSQLVLENLTPYSKQNAFFTADGSKIIALTQQEAEKRILVLDANTFDVLDDIETTQEPANLIQYASSETIYYEAGNCKGLHFCTTESYHGVDTATSQDTLMEGKERLVFSPDGSSMAFRDPQYADEVNYYHNPMLFYEELEQGISSRRLFGFPHPGGFRVHPEITKYVFSPDSTALFVLQDAYSDYFEKSVGVHFFLEDLEQRIVLEYGSLEGAYGSLSPIPVWSPDGDALVLLLINTTNDRDFTFELFRKDMLNRFSAFEPLMEPQPLEGYGYPNHAFWVKETLDEEQ